MSHQNGTHPEVSDTPIVPTANPPPPMPEPENDPGDDEVDLSPGQKRRWSGFGGRLGLAVCLLVFAQLIARSCTPPERQTAFIPVPQPSSAPSPSPSPQVEPSPSQPVNQGVIRRNALLEQSIEQGWAIADQMVCARKEFFRREAEQKLAEAGTSIERYLVEKLQAVNSKNQAETVTRANFDGSPDLISTARSLNMDALALLLALQDLHEGKPLTQCSIAPASAILTIQQFTDQSALLLQSDPQSQLEIQSQIYAPQPEAPPILP